MSLEIKYQIPEGVEREDYVLSYYDVTSVKLNGVEIGNDIVELHLHAKGGDFILTEVVMLITGNKITVEEDK